MAGEVMATFGWSEEKTLYRIDFSKLIFWYDIARHRNYGIPLVSRINEKEQLKKIENDYIWNEERNCFEAKKHKSKRE